MDWKCVDHSSKVIQKLDLASTLVLDDPLKVKNVQNGKKENQKLKPQKDILLFDGSDPLSNAGIDLDLSPTNLESHSQYDSWSTRRGIILSRYTTSEKLSIITSFLAGGEIIKSTTTVSDKVKHRLEQLDNFDENPVRQMGNLSQSEYAAKIEQLGKSLGEAWDTDQRVKALKIVIQCSKLLADVSVMQFYPSKFVLVTDILDYFGKLVYDRLKNKSEFFRPGSLVTEKLPDEFTLEMVPETTKETCLNWFYKVASIRELLPRFYVEAAILRSYSFLCDTENILATLNRLALISRGIGDPLVAIYARCYLCRVAMTINHDNPAAIHQFFRQVFDDSLNVYQTVILLLASPIDQEFLPCSSVLLRFQVFLGNTRAEVTRQRLQMPTYILLYAPAFEWILHGLVVGTSDYTLDELVLRSQEQKNCSFLFHCILMTFPKRFIALRALHFVNIICKCDTEAYTRSQLLRALGSCLSELPPPENQIDDVFNYVWRTIATFTQVEEYLTCLETWMPFVVENLSLLEVNIVLEDLINRCRSSNSNYENFYSELFQITEKTSNCCENLFEFFALDTFLPLLGLFKKESVKVDICKVILKRLTTIETPLSDLIHINALMHVCKTLNDSVNTLTVDDERRQISDYVTFFIRLVDFGTDFEQKLSFCVDARAAFPNLEVVYTGLVHVVNKLAMDTWKMVDGRHTRKTGAFVKDCIAYNFVTIPSIIQIVTRLDLYLLTGKVALVNSCLGQADACFENGLKLVLEMPHQIEIDGKIKSSGPYLQSYLKNFLATLIIVPDSPDQGVLYLLRLLIDVTKKYGFETNILIEIYFEILDTLCIMSQEVYPYHALNVISNDELYGHDPKYIEEINNLCTQICSHILVNLKILADHNNLRQQAKFALQLFSQICNNSDVTADKTCQLAVNLFNLAVKQRAQLDTNIFIYHLKELEKRINDCEDNENRLKLLEIFKRVHSKIDI